MQSGGGWTVGEQVQQPCRQWTERVTERICPHATPLPTSVTSLYTVEFGADVGLRQGLCSPGSPGTSSVGQAGLELAERSACLCHKSAGIKGERQHSQLTLDF